MTMTSRIAIVSALFVGFAIVSGALSQPPTTRDDINNGKNGDKTKEWVVRYDKTETVGKMFKRAIRKPEQQAIRLQITKSGGNYKARLWRFKAKTGGGYDLVDKTDNAANDPISLATEGNNSGRHRKAFKSASVPLYDKFDNPTGEFITINGIWQPGHNTSERLSDRVQLKLYATRSTKPTTPAPSGGYDNCEEDPDTDVLEETDPPPDEDGAPPP
jgi:hypothetical protein